LGGDAWLPGPVCDPRVSRRSPTVRARAHFRRAAQLDCCAWTAATSVLAVELATNGEVKVSGLTRLRRLFDLDSDPSSVGSHLLRKKG
jgi:hypothetical protein